MSYSDKLRDPRWQRTRLKIMERDDWKCRACGAVKIMLHVHHVAYIKQYDPWQYDDSWLVTLCESCHQRVEDELMPALGKWACTHDARAVVAMLEMMGHTTRHDSSAMALLCSGLEQALSSLTTPTEQTNNLLTQLRAYRVTLFR